MENRIVFDTNIWISYIIAARYDELELMVTNNLFLLRSAPSLNELQEVLTRKKFQKYNIDIDKTIMFYTNLTEFCKTEPLFNACLDPEDSFLFDLAIQGNAHYLVSGDKKVLETPLENKTLKLTSLMVFKEMVNKIDFLV
ncbi:MAG: putative toxin-antitoxin system toxin component, PIN family [Marinilabiliaceae bacterium]|nr:putative toxin-antitoxin system toxin component, PIN family [Marinilabiliaceae bacterium]